MHTCMVLPQSILCQPLTVTSCTGINFLLLSSSDLFLDQEWKSCDASDVQMLLVFNFHQRSWFSQWLGDYGSCHSTLSGGLQVSSSCSRCEPQLATQAGKLHITPAADVDILSASNVQTRTRRERNNGGGSKTSRRSDLEEDMVLPQKVMWMCCTI